MSKRSSSRVASSAAKRTKEEEEKRLKFDLSWNYVGDGSPAALIFLDGPSAAANAKKVRKQTITLTYLQTFAHEI